MPPSGRPTEQPGIDRQRVADHPLEGEVRLDMLRHYPATQMLDESHVTLSSEGIRLNPVVQRYAWPAELDLMARIAGLRLKERWDDWSRRPYTATGSTVVSVYGR